MSVGLENGDGRPFNRDGLYRQKETGAEMYLENKTPEYGSPMIDAFVKGGWVFVSEERPVVVEAIETTPDSIEEDVSTDVYTQTTTKSGQVQYRHNGKLISKDEYDNKI